MEREWLCVKNLLYEIQMTKSLTIETDAERKLLQRGKYHGVTLVYSSGTGAKIVRIHEQEGEE